MAPGKNKKVAFSFDQQTPTSVPRHDACKLRCFDGLTRRTTEWDGLRKDHQLWFPGGNCVVHFAAPSSTEQRPALQLPLHAVESLKCQFPAQHTLKISNISGSEADVEDSGDDSGYSSSPSDDGVKRLYELYIPAPQGLSKKEELSYHLTTRNFFAYALSRPVVGQRLSIALLELWHRILAWLPTDNKVKSAFTLYLQKQGYLDFAENSEHALACVQVAEVARLPKVWLDAFAHCVGMRERLDLSPEYKGLKDSTIAMIIRTALDMDLKIVRTIHTLGGFLEDELGPEHLGLSKVARSHLDRFRSFLHSFYLEKIGYYPPHEDDRWNRTLWSSIQSDFECLYGYLVDKNSTSDLASNNRLEGGICVHQNINFFDERHGYEPLPHPLPLLPAASTGLAIGGRRRSLLLRKPSLLSKETQTGAKVPVILATNIDDDRVMLCPLVQEYQRFERQKLEDKLDPVEARKVRWMLIYCTLQMLNSIISAPKHVNNAYEVPYPLCISTTALPAWIEEALLNEPDDTEASAPMLSPVHSHLLLPEESDDGRTSRISIHPDCEADYAKTLLGSNSNGSNLSLLSPISATQPAWPKHPLSRTNSFRASVQSLHRSVVDSIIRRNSNRRPSIQSDIAEADTDTIFPIAVQDGTDGNTRTHECAIQTMQSNIEEGNSFSGFDFGLAGQNSEPTLEYHQVDYEGVENKSLLSPLLKTSPGLEDHVKSSYNSSEDLQIVQNHNSTGIDYGNTALRENRRSSRSAARINITAGCYIPTGMVAASPSRDAFHRDSTLPVDHFDRKPALAQPDIYEADEEYDEDDDEEHYRLAPSHHRSLTLQCSEQQRFTRRVGAA